jgi:hypothetical protein
MTLPSCTARARLLARVGTACLLIAGAGCSRGPATGDVSGKVTLNGKPVPSAVITFLAEGGRMGNGQIKDGEYHIPEAPQGPVQIEIAGGSGGTGKVKMPPSMKKFIPEDQQGVWEESVGKGAPRARVVVPARYGKSSTSGLSYQVTPGKQVHDIDLKP